MQGEELTDRFLRILTDLAVSHCLTGETSSMTMRPGLLYFVAVDAYVRLLTMLITGLFYCPLLAARYVHAGPVSTAHCLLPQELRSCYALKVAVLIRHAKAPIKPALLKLATAT